jgi:hypothetical protein
LFTLGILYVMNSRSARPFARNSFPSIFLRTALHEYQNEWLRRHFFRILSPSFSHSCALRFPQLFSFDILAKNTRVGGSIGPSNQRAFCSPPAPPPLTSHSSLATNSFRMRTYKSEHPIRMRVPRSIATRDLSEYKPRGMNTYERLSKQRTSTPFGMNTYKKHGGRGVSLLPTVRVPFHQASHSSLVYPAPCGATSHFLLAMSLFHLPLRPIRAPRGT